MSSMLPHGIPVSHNEILTTIQIITRRTNERRVGRDMQGHGGKPGEGSIFIIVECKP